MQVRGRHLRGYSMLMAALLIFGLTNASLAGERLYLKAGVFDTVDMSKNPEWFRAVGSRPPAVGRALYLVQFINRITPQDHRNLSSLGATVLYYIPDDALLVEIAGNMVATLKKSSTNIRFVSPYTREMKADLSISFSRLSADNEGVFYVQSSSPARFNAAVEGMQVIEAQDQFGVVKGTYGRLFSVLNNEGIVWVQPYEPMHTMAFDILSESENAGSLSAGDYSDINGSESGTSIMKFEQAWNSGWTGRGQVVAIADTGLDNGDSANIHPDFAGAVKAGHIFGLYAKSWDDPMGHGTHVTGSIAGQGAAPGSNQRIRGGAYEAMVVPQGMWSPILGNLTVPPKLENLFGKAQAEGARVHNNSWGSSNNPGQYENMATQVDEFMFNNPDFLILFAAGNDGKDMNKDGRIDGGSVGSPATAKNCLSVGASKNKTTTGGIQRKLKELSVGAKFWITEPLGSSMLSENENGLAPFSSRGPTLDGRLKPDIVAPGTNILSDRSSHKDASPLWGEYNQYYAWSGGTSMSTPLTAGAAAVVRQYLTEERQFSNPSAALVKAVLMHTADDMYPGQFGEIGASSGQEILAPRPDADQGFGRVNMATATALAQTLLVDDRSGLGSGEKSEHTVRVSSGGTLMVTLVYMDAPGSPSAAKALVNDLDLEIVSPDGKVQSRQDRINNSEYFELSNAAAGVYTVRVIGQNIPRGVKGTGKQPYALVVSLK